MYDGAPNTKLDEVNSPALRTPISGANSLTPRAMPLKRQPNTGE
ncbi:Uncharacterised protein [Mycobacterium tuberculosis]|uniref:Uncharacterized protein n=1 Tax=Mycobacterium tuberculosis TaxID=1773 RepID=A0A916PGE5_MYCTX|nr:Uncharacterised protein [Mycobacterium tuberculosis]COX20751.1 Uncharacterised protein [Mycobacterium tuberculosis]COX93134.1 Uncharacterised protein [Mycobacterium tuberculosis]CPA10044.1 Uncharacterised protein [Mycobacterium tuberculosis]